ncbi:unnamed protein product [Sphenostylis stenocarpa]|uniref:Fe2OG dioxygenase domain-containing protein n=1 Tax=Sphenostylis stenocarpa TaxID=92480 RepID=A0AA86VN81_9FABA|nr:unnamed protein product [Sphenostylis stenocarpa]
MEVNRVQNIATLSMEPNTIPEEFIRPETEQPAITTFEGDAPDIPTIDLSNPDQENLVKLISEAAEEWGIFQVVNHGIPSELMHKLQSVGKEFFQLPQKEKEKYARSPDAKSLQGYGTDSLFRKLHEGAQGKKAWTDHLFHKIWPPSCIDYKFWPQNPVSYGETNEEYAKEVRRVAEKVFTCLSLGLGLEGHVMKEGAGGDELEYMLKINFYPPCPRPDLALGLTPHADFSLTVLMPNEVPGLQILKDDIWIRANYIPNALIIIIGDQIQILSNGRYKSVTHRTTVDKERTRISWPVFVEPPGEWVVGPLSQLVTEDNPPKYKAKKFKDYVYCKLNLPQ